MQNKSANTMLKHDLDRQRVQYFHAPHLVTEDVWMAASFSNVFAMQTDVGLLMIDAGLRGVGAQIQQALRQWSDRPIHTLILTHGHLDHMGGLKDFRNAGDLPQHIIAHENVLDRFDRYEMLHGWNGYINMVQFGLDKPTFPRNPIRPTQTFHDKMTLSLGDLTVELFATKGETDDMCFIWIPEKRYLFCGDLFEWTMPNTGNPRKMERHPLEWAQALEQMMALDPEVLFPGHGFVLQGRESIQTLLGDAAALNRDFVTQVVDRLNAGQSHEEIYHAVEAHPELIRKWYLRPFYDHPKFVVRNLLRKYGGWWNGISAELLPAPYKAQSEAIVALAGGVEAVIDKGRALLEADDLALAAHHADWAVQAAPDDEIAQAFVRDVYEARMNAEKSLMARGIYRNVANKARKALGQKPLPSHTGALMG